MSNQTQPKQDNSLQQVLSQLEKFGFRFFGYSESKDPLVIAPNGQVITVSVAYNFMQSQIAKASTTGGTGNFENMPAIPTMPQMPNPEGGVEKKTEQGPDQNNNLNEINLPTVQTPLPASQAPKIVVDKDNSSSPFGDGFNIASFDATDLNKVSDYISKNSQRNNQSARTWLTIQLEKYLAERRNQSN